MKSDISPERMWRYYEDVDRLRCYKSTFIGALVLHSCHVLYGDAAIAGLHFYTILYSVGRTGNFYWWMRSGPLLIILFVFLFKFDKVPKLFFSLRAFRS